MAKRSVSISGRPRSMCAVKTSATGPHHPREQVAGSAWDAAFERGRLRYSSRCFAMAPYAVRPPVFT